MISVSHIGRSRAAVITFAAVFLFQSAAFAAGAAHGGEAHHPGPGDLLWPAVNFITYVALMFFLLKGKIVSGLKARSEVVATAINKASREIDAAKAELAGAQSKLASLSGEVDRLTAEIAVEGDKEAAQVVDDAKARAKRILDQANKSAEGEVKATQVAIRKELADLVIKKAEEILSREINADADKRLRGAALRELGSLH